MLLNARRLPREGHKDLILLALEDVTDRRKMEAALKDSEQKLRTLNADLMISQESERQAVSLALHEELAQNLAALKLKLGAIKRHLPSDQPGAKEDLDQALHSIEPW